MNIKALIGSIMAVALLGFGVIVGGIAGVGSTAAQTTVTTPQTAPQTAPKTDPQTAPQTAPKTDTQIENQTAPQTTKATITQQQAEQAALAANPGNTVDHSRLMGDNSGTAFWDVDFTNGGGAKVNAETGAVITSEAAGADMGGHGKGGRMGGADQAALAAKAKITQKQAEQAALAASPGNTVDHTRLGGDPNGVIFWDVDFANGGGVTVNAETGAVIATEAAGNDHGGRFGGGSNEAPPATQP